MRSNTVERPRQQNHFLEYWHVVRKRRWVILTSLAALFTTVTIGSFLVRPTYQATAVIQIERQNPNMTDFNDIFARDSSTVAYNDFYRTQYRLIRSREVLRRVAERTDLSRHPAMAQATRPGPLSRLKAWAGALLGSGPPAGEGLDEWSPWIESLDRNLSIVPVKSTHLVEIAFESVDPALAARVANATAEEYILFNSDVKSRTTGIAGEKLDTEIQKVTAEIRDLDRELRRLGEESSIVDMGNKRTLAMSVLEELTRSTTQASIARARSEAAFESVRNADPSSLDEVRSSQTVKEIKTRLSELEREYIEKRSLFKPDYPEMVALRSQIDLVESQLRAETDIIRGQVVRAAETAYRKTQGEEERLAQLEQTQKDRVHQIERNLAAYDTLRSSLEAKKETRLSLSKRRDETGIMNRMDDTQSGNVWLVETAELPRDPFSPNRKLNMALALILGAGVGLGLAFFFEYLDNSIKNAEDQERSSGLPTLGTIPGLRRRGNGKVIAMDSGGRTVDVECVTHEAPKSNVAEAYRDLRTTLLLSSPDRPPRILMVTSSQPQEGKTVTALNVGISLTQVGKKVLLLDADLRKPRLHKPLGLARTNGLTNSLTGNANWRDLVQSTHIPSLSVLAAGPIPPNPAELLASNSFSHLLQELRDGEDFDHVVVDTPPLLAVADPVIVSEHVDGVLVVVRAGETPHQTLQAGLEKLRASNARLLGAVLNALDLAEHDYYAYRYGYRYGYYNQAESDLEPGDDRSGRTAAGGAS